MRQLMFLLMLCLSLSVYGQDLIISEVTTGADWIELHNPITNPPIDPTGYTVFGSENNACPASRRSSRAVTSPSRSPWWLS